MVDIDYSVFKYPLGSTAGTINFVLALCNKHRGSAYTIALTEQAMLHALSEG